MAAPALRPVDARELPDMLADALAGGPAVGPLPSEPTDRDRALAVLAPAEPVSEPDAAAVVTTSGSTGSPKGVVLSRSAIRSSVAGTHARLGGPGEWVLALPPHYVAGLMVAARAVLAGSPLHVIDPQLAGLPRLPPSTDRRYLSIVPTQLVRALADPSITDALSRLDAVLLGGAPAGRELLAAARAAGVPVITTYGMSETCGGCVYDGQPLDGVSVDLDLDGRIGIAGPVVFSGYRLRPDLTADILIGGRVRTQDRGRWDGGRLAVLGRLDDVVITGGHNVDLADLERRLLSWSQLAQAEIAVIAIPDPTWGSTIIAVTDAPVGLTALIDHLAPQVAPHALPRRLIRLDSLPQTANGKIDRPALRAMLQTHLS